MIDILYIEDNENDADIFGRLIRKIEQPITYTILSSGSDAVDYLSGKGRYAGQSVSMPKLVLLDINLTGMSGLDVLAWARSLEKTRWLPIVAFSTSDSPMDIQQAYAAGINAYLVKPGSYQATGTLLNHLCQFWLTDNTRTDYR
ncbi:response regulator [Fibrella aquatica]|uniref:response regulator n=1 Tax=Fibrella aquatica TaxID=3242487 RepID=UPI003521472E